jgi:hypothetical protein
VCKGTEKESGNRLFKREVFAKVGGRWRSRVGSRRGRGEKEERGDEDGYWLLAASSKMQGSSDHLVEQTIMD